MAAAAVAIAAAAATTAAASFSGSAAAAALGPRLTGVGVLLPTVFLGLAFLVAVVLELVLGASLEGVGLLSVLERLGVFVSAALLVGGFLAVTADLGVSGFDDLAVEEGLVMGDSADFFAAGVAGLLASFFKGVFCDAGGLPPEGVVEVGLEAAGLGVDDDVLVVAGLAVTEELLVVEAVDGRAEPVAGRDGADVAVVGLLVLETGVLLTVEAEVGFVGVAEAGLGAGGFLVAAELLVLTPFAVVDGVFLTAAVPVVDFAPLVAGEGPVAFFSPTFAVVLEAGAPAVPVGFLVDADAVVLFLSRAGVAFFAMPLVWGFDTPFERRL